MSLFLYLEPEAGLALLRESRLPFVPLDQLLDPFVSNHAVRDDAPRRQATQQEIEQELVRQYQALPAHLAELISFDYFREQAQDKRAALEAAILARDQKPEVETLTPAQIQALTVLQLFSSAQSPVLWERYADRYRGVLVELDPQDENLKASLYQGKPQLLQAVHYGDERPARDPAQRFASLFQRPRSFAAEGEWRLLRPRVVAEKSIERQGREYCLYRISPRTVRGLVFGCNMPADQRERFIRLIEHDQRYRHLAIQECCVDPYRFELHLRDFRQEGEPQ